MKSNRLAVLLLLLLVGGGIAARCFNVALLALTRDESFSWRISTRPAIEMMRDLAGDTHPPGHFVVLKVWQSVFGSSPCGLRSLSAICGGFTILVVYLAVFEALASPNRQGAALCAAALVAVHAGQVIAGQTARMYSLAALMAALTAWLLLKALHAPPRAHRFWWAYGFSVAGLLYSHHYGWFTLAAQIIFVLGVIARRMQRNPRDALSTTRGLLLAHGTAVVLYSPWLPVFWAQAHRVHQEFWIPSPDASRTYWTFIAWLTGMQYLVPLEQWLVVLLLAANTFWLLAQRNSAAIFFLLQAAAPWGATFAVSAWGGRPLLQDRYLVLSQVALIAYLGVGCAGIPSTAIRRASAASRGLLTWRNVSLAAALSWAWFWCSLCGYGCLSYLSSQPNMAPPVAIGTAWLGDHYRLGDRVMTRSSAELNLVRYYLQQAGISEIDVRCPLSVFPPRGQESHIASLHRGDVVNSPGEIPSTVQRLWIVNDAPGRPAVWSRVRERTFADPRPPNGGTYKLALYGRPRATDALQ